MKKFIKLVNFYSKHGLVETARLIQDRLYWRVHHYLPKNESGMRRWSYYQFRRVHKRNPRPQAQLLNDYLYQVKMDGTLEDPLRVFVSDKEYLKLFVRAVAGNVHNVPTTAVLRSREILMEYQFPERCCIKATHGSGRVVLRKCGEEIDRLEIARWFEMNYYIESGEINYRTLEPTIIVEPLVFDSDTVKEFKIFCFCGKPKAILVVSDRFQSLKRKILSVDWSDLGVRLATNNAGTDIPDKPKTLKEMLDLASMLAAYFDGLIRVDLYSDGEQILVSELTNCHLGANEMFVSYKDEVKLSQLLFE
jgi:hypothetical protein